MIPIVTFTPNPAIDVSTSVEKFEPFRKLRCASPQRDPGGGGINAGRVISRLGGDVTALFPAGGATGRLLVQLVHKEGIRSITVPVEEETREDFTVREESTGAQYRFVMPGPRLSADEWQGCLDALTAIEARGGIVLASGSLPSGVPNDLYARAARHAAELGARFVLDTSGPALEAGLSAPVFLIKPNLGELQKLVGTEFSGEDECIAAARSLVASDKAEVVALTLGHRGAFLITAEGVLRAPPLKVKQMSAVGAGDSFLGALVWSLARGDDLAEAFRYGVAAGTACLLHEGTQLCHAADVYALYKTVVVEPM
jgi:6-phosphofructokinase 2